MESSRDPWSGAVVRDQGSGIEELDQDSEALTDTRPLIPDLDCIHRAPPAGTCPPLAGIVETAARAPSVRCRHERPVRHQRAEIVRRRQGARRRLVRAAPGRAARAARSERRRQDDADPGDRRPRAPRRGRDSPVRSRRSATAARRRSSASSRRRSRSIRCSPRARTSTPSASCRGSRARSASAGRLGARPHRARPIAQRSRSSSSPAA